MHNQTALNGMNIGDEIYDKRTHSELPMPPIPCIRCDQHNMSTRTTTRGHPSQSATHT
jgi:hypothetical protein